MFVGDDSECGFYQQYLYPTTNLLKPSAQAPWEGAALGKLQRFVCTQGIKVSAIFFLYSGGNKSCSRTEGGKGGETPKCETKEKSKSYRPKTVEDQGDWIVRYNTQIIV